MRKIKNRIFAIIISMLIAVNAMSVCASATVTSPSYSWSLSTALPSGAPTNTQGYYVMTVTRENTFGATMHYHYSKCNTYIAPPTSNGDRAHANYSVTITDLNHNVLGVASGKMHKTTGTVKTTLPVSFSYGRYCITSYSLYRPANSTATIKGVLYFKDNA